jgi:DNA ligase 1
MLNFHRPLLAASLLPPDSKHDNDTILTALQRLRFPVCSSLKMDGIRAIRTSDLFSRTLHLIPNLSVRYRSMKLPAGFDCELWNSQLQYHEVESIVMSAKHEREHLIEFHAIDWFIEHMPYYMRCSRLAGLVTDAWADVFFKMPIICHTPRELLEYFLKVEQEEGEGICFRLANSPYKQGRSTLREQYLVKLCRYVRTECVVIGLEEQMCNANTKRYNAVGLMDRQSLGVNMIGKNTMGAFIVRDSNGLEFRVGTGVGLTDALRKEIWDNQDKWIGQTIVIKHKPHGLKVKPRSPVFCGKRNEIDL